jgi:predicted metal-dependent hydrolase
VPRKRESATSFFRSFLDWLSPPEAKPAVRTREAAPPPRQMQFVYGNASVPYELTRASRKTVSMVVSREGLVVRAPLRLAQREIDAVLAERGAWIVARVQEWQQRTALLAADYADEGSVLVRGKRMRFRCQASLFESLEVTEDTLTLASPAPLPFDQRRTLVEKWLREKAQAELAPMVLQLASDINVSVKRVKFTDTKTMWGSCTSDGVVRLTFRLIQLPPALAYYVIAHELSHRHEMNHSPRFWEWVRHLDPHYKSHRRTLAHYTPILEEGA